MILIKLDALKKAAAELPPGYMDDVLSLAVAVDAQRIKMKNADYDGLQKKYSPEAFTQRASNDSRHARIAVGDLVERMLASVGITKERVQQWTRTKDCGCKARQQWLNRWGYQKQNQVERLLKKAARWYGIG
jgi:hypothetical protein